MAQETTNGASAATCMFIASILAHRLLVDRLRSPTALQSDHQWGWPTALQSSRGKKQFVEFSNSALPEGTLVVDCSHPTAPQITHHLKNDQQRKAFSNLEQIRGDSTTDGVLNAIHHFDPTFMSTPYVSSNHFDVDSFLSVWCCCNPLLALEHEIALREMARVGDFRELQLLDQQNQLGREQDRALRCVCWLNSEEKRLFYQPFGSTMSASDGEEVRLLMIE
jgi:hypothetical protein